MSWRTIYDDIFTNAIKADIYDKVRNGKFSRKEEDLSEKPLTKKQKEYYDKVEVFMEKLKNQGDNVLADFLDKYAKVPKEEK